MFKRGVAEFISLVFALCVVVFNQTVAQAEVPEPPASTSSTSEPQTGSQTDAKARDAGPGDKLDTPANPPAEDASSTRATPVTSEGAPEEGTKETTAESSSSESPPANKTTLKGGVRGAALLTEDGLVGIESDAKMLQMNVFEIARECTRKETAVMRGPNYIGNGIVIPAIGNPNGTVQIGDLPARRDKLEAFLGSSEEVFEVLQNHMDALILPENPPEQLSNLWTGMRSTLQAAKGNIDKMKELLEIKKFDKKQVGRAALKVYDSMTALEKMRSQILALVQKKE